MIQLLAGLNGLSQSSLHLDVRVSVDLGRYLPALDFVDQMRMRIEAGQVSLVTLSVPDRRRGAVVCRTLVFSAWGGGKSGDVDGDGVGAAELFFILPHRSVSVAVQQRARGGHARRGDDLSGALLGTCRRCLSLCGVVRREFNPSTKRVATGQLG